MAEEPSLTMPTFVVVMLTILVWELVLRPLVMDPTIRLGIVNIDKLWPHRETLWKHRQLLWERRREMEDVLPELLLERNMAVLGPHIGVVLEEYDVIMPHRKQLLYHLPAMAPHLREFVKMRRLLLPHIAPLTKHAHVLVPKMGVLLAESQVLTPYLPKLIADLDLIVPFLDDLLELKDILLPHLNVIIVHRTAIIPNISVLMDPAVKLKMLPHLDVLVRNMRYYMDYVNHPKFPELINYIDDLSPYLDELAPHAPMLLPHLDRLLPHIPIFLEHIDTLLPHMGKTITHMDALMDMFEWSLPTVHKMIELPGVARALPAIGAFLKRTASGSRERLNRASASTGNLLSASNSIDDKL